VREEQLAGRAAAGLMSRLLLCQIALQRGRLSTSWGELL
jgi:hypothetical protein